jgi:hypothetical protein
MSKYNNSFSSLHQRVTPVTIVQDKLIWQYILNYTITLPRKNVINISI